MKKMLFAATILVASTGLASAADLGVYKPAPQPYLAPAFSWSGFYIGAHAGYGWGSTDTVNQLFFPGGPAFGANSTSFDTDGWLVGGQAGYNYQFSNNLVVGVEGDFAWSDVKGDFNYDPLRPEAIAGGKVDYQGTLRLRLGYAIDRFLPYVTGGLAYAHTKGFADNIWGGGDHNTSSKDAWGWALGAGVEYAFTQNISAKVEYIYTRFDDVKSVMPIGGGAPAGSSNALSSDLTQSAVKVGVNYRF